MEQTDSYNKSDSQGKSSTAEGKKDRSQYVIQPPDT
jgi:hypothetical protein